MSDDDPIEITDAALKAANPHWPWKRFRTYQLVRDPRDGRPALKVIRVGRRVFTTRRAMAEFLAARMSGGAK